VWELPGHWARVTKGEQIMKRYVAVALLLWCTSLYARPQVSTLSGKWTMTVEGHNGMAMSLEIKQEGKKLTGNLIIPDHGDLDLVGEFDNGKLTLSTTENGYMQVRLAGDLKGDGTLSGNLSSAMGDMVWMAKRSDGE
jgi:hypothetical protein